MHQRDGSNVVTCNDFSHDLNGIPIYWCIQMSWKDAVENNLTVILFGTLVAAIGIVAGALSFINKQIDESISSNIVDNVEFWKVAQRQVSNIKLEKGIYEIPSKKAPDICPSFRENPNPLATKDNGNLRTCTIPIKFNIPFENKPEVFISMTSFDVETHHTENLPEMTGRFKITSAVDHTTVTKNGFDLFVRAGRNIKLSWIEFHWLAIESD